MEYLVGLKLSELDELQRKLSRDNRLGVISNTDKELLTKVNALIKKRKGIFDIFKK